MINKYKHLLYAIQLFSADLEYTEEEYGQTFFSFVTKEPEYANKIKAELLQAISDPEWSWVKVGYETNFIGSDDKEKSVWLTVKVLIWDVLFPNVSPPEIVQRDGNNT